MFFFLFALYVFSAVHVDDMGRVNPMIELNEQEQSSILTRFRNYIQIDTSQPKPDYYSSVEYLKGICEDIVGLETTIVEMVEGKPMLVCSWKCNLGDMQEGPNILLSSHQDVVPVDPTKWNYPPFGAEMNEMGDIFGRGTQDMKSIGMSYLEAIFLLKKEQFLPNRDVHVLFTADEEIGSEDGAASFVESPFFFSLNIGMVLDEGVPQFESNTFDVYYGEKTIIWVKWLAEGPGGHGSRFIPNTSTMKATRLMQFLLDFRNEQESVMLSNDLDITDVITLNVDILKAGETKTGERPSVNVIPKQTEVFTDMRFPPTYSLSDILSLLDSWALTFDVSYEFVHPVHDVYVSDVTIDPVNNSLFTKFISSLQELNIVSRIRCLPYASDARYFRKYTNAYGFSPIGDTVMLLHDKNEYLNKDVYFKSILTYKHVLQQLCS